MTRGKVFAALQRRFRANRFKRLEALIRSLLPDRAEITILDAGGRPDYWQMLPADLRAKTRITVLNFASELALYPKTASDLQIDCVVGDACDMPQFADHSFDLVHSNSVIEHVGSYQNMRRFAEETRRVGRAYFVQTPNFGFPIDPHYGIPLVHWLPDTLKIWAFPRFTVGDAHRCSFEQARVDLNSP